MKKLKVIIPCFVLLLGLLAFLPKQEEQIIWSKGHPLTWDDFKGRPINNSSAGTMSNVSTGSHYECKNNLLTFKIESLFYPSKSWVKNNDKTIATLEHEQLHFDIVELYSRKLRKAIMETKLSVKNFKAKYEEIYITIKKDKDAMQELYDKETTSPRNEVKQKEWLEKIAKELAELAAYSNPVIEIKVK